MRFKAQIRNVNIFASELHVSNMIACSILLASPRLVFLFAAFSGPVCYHRDSILYLNSFLQKYVHHFILSIQWHGYVSPAPPSA